MTPEIDTQDWQQAFIATNILAIGYKAWIGYLAGERGAVICSTNSPHLRYYRLNISNFSIVFTD